MKGVKEVSSGFPQQELAPACTETTMEQNQAFLYAAVDTQTTGAQPNKQQRKIQPIYEENQQ